MGERLGMGTIIMGIDGIKEGQVDVNSVDVDKCEMVVRRYHTIVEVESISVVTMLIENPSLLLRKQSDSEMYSWICNLKPYKGLFETLIYDCSS